VEHPGQPLVLDKGVARTDLARKIRTIMAGKRTNRVDHGAPDMIDTGLGAAESAGRLRDSYMSLTDTWLWSGRVKPVTIRGGTFMTRSARPRLLVGVVLTGAIALLGLTGCGRFGSGTETTDTEMTDVAREGQALQAIGYSTEDVALASDPTAAATATGGPSDRADRRELRHKRLRIVFRNTLHGEAVVQTDEGTKTVVVQRGTVTAVSGTSITVKSTDGFTLNWNVGASTTVIVKRVKAQIGDVAVGTDVGIAGSKDGDATNARLVVVPVKRG
jgi:hypothetical protein